VPENQVLSLFVPSNKVMLSSFIHFLNQYSTSLKEPFAAILPSALPSLTTQTSELLKFPSQNAEDGDNSVQRNQRLSKYYYLNLNFKK